MSCVKYFEVYLYWKNRAIKNIAGGKSRGDTLCHLA